LKKTALFGILLLLILQTGGLVMIGNLHQWLIKAEVWLDLEQEDENMNKIILSLDEFEKSRINTFEFKWKGEMYDFKSHQIQGDSVYLMARKDDDENHVLKCLMHLLRESQGNDQCLLLQFVKWLSIPYTCPDAEWLVFIEHFKPRKNFWYIDRLYFVLTELNTPPPKYLWA